MIFSNLFNWQFFNTVFVLRCILKFFTETLTEEQLIGHIEQNSITLESLIGALIGIVVDVPVNNATYAFHLETVTCLLILLSVQVHSDRKADQSAVYRVFMRGKHIIHAPILIKCLVVNFINQEKLPPNYTGNNGQSIVLGIIYFHKITSFKLVLKYLRSSR